MSKTCGNSKLFDVWAATGTKVEPSTEKKNSGWLHLEQPPHEHMNWLQNLFSQKLNYAMRSGIPEWDSETAYLAGDYARVGNNVYYAIVPNTNHMPPHSSWRSWGSDFGLGKCPIGSIMAFLPGHFTNASNGGFTCGLASNDMAAVNAEVNDDGWYGCDGSVLYLVGSKYYSETGRNLPNLTNDRFLMGSTTSGTPGGSNVNSVAHVHATKDFKLEVDHVPAHKHTITINTGGNHNHQGIGERGRDLSCSDPPRIVGGHGGPGDRPWYTGFAGDHTHIATCSYLGGGLSHSHGDTESAGSESLENRPRYLSCFYIVRVF